MTSLSLFCLAAERPPFEMLVQTTLQVLVGDAVSGSVRVLCVCLAHPTQRMYEQHPIDNRADASLSVVTRVDSRSTERSSSQSLLPLLCMRRLLRPSQHKPKR